MVVINKKDYFINLGEFSKEYIQEYCNLNIYKDVGHLERISGLIRDLGEAFDIDTLSCISVTHGGFVAVELSPFFNKIFVSHIAKKHSFNVSKNIERFSSNIEITTELLSTDLLFIQNQSDDYDIEPFQLMRSIVVVDNEKRPLQLSDYKRFELSRDTTSSHSITLYIPCEKYEQFYKEFHFYFKQDVFDYNNLIHLCIMVKNAGPQFEKMLSENLDIIDRWTILDTGSTDETVDIIKKVLVGQKKGELFQEPFINFRDSRNRLFDLAGKKCKFILTLDDTYVIKGNLRKFLNTIRGDQFGDSYSLSIISGDSEYSSNRIIKSESNLRYIFRIHEIISPHNNNNVEVPTTESYIVDYQYEYMRNRTRDRKLFDLQLLFQELEEDPDNSRTYYYIGQTYLGIEDYQNAYEWFLKRVQHHDEGFIQEKYDALFEAARLANFRLNRPWKECMQLYEQAFELDKSRPEAIYFIGIHYYLENSRNLAYIYFKQAFSIGFPSHCHYSLKPTLSFYFIPKFLSELCYTQNDYALGEQVCLYYFQHNKREEDKRIEGENTINTYDTMVSWYSIYKRLNEPIVPVEKIISKKPIMCFVADGGYSQWSGKNIYTSGVGGSETFIIEMARHTKQFQVFVFCNCEKDELVDGVQYIHLSKYKSFIHTNTIHSCIISRFSEYLPVTYQQPDVQNVYYILHDISPIGNVVIRNSKLRQVFCLSDWHVESFVGHYPIFKDITTSFSYGIDISVFKPAPKVHRKFIYSSFPNRGLLPLLRLWGKIWEMDHQCSLHIYCDVNGKWVNETEPGMMNEIKNLLMNKEFTESRNIFYHGWVDKATLAEAWSTSEYWLYPCIFSETFCLTAMEAAMSKTLAITNDLAALQNTVGDRGKMVKGNVLTEEWSTRVLEVIRDLFQNDTEKNVLIERNYKHALELSWEKRARELTRILLPQKTLIYFCVFCNDAYVRLVRLLLRSLRQFGEYDGDILIYTTTEIKKKINETIDDTSILYAINDSIYDIDRACKSRLDVFDFPGISNYNKILYIDTDILINDKIQPVFDVCTEEVVYCVGDLPIDHDFGYFGKLLFSPTQLEVIHDKTGMNSGILLFKRCEKIKKLFQDIKKDMVVRDHLNIFHDQPYINYHCIVNNLAERYQLKPLAINTDNEEELVSHSIIHFNGFPPGNFDYKYKKMVRYYLLKLIRQTEKCIQQHLMPVVHEVGELLEGSLFNPHRVNELSDTYIEKKFNISELCVNNNIRSVLEIGFNAGFSSLLMLMSDPNITITCVDICEHRYTKRCYEVLKEMFGDRITLLEGDSTVVVPTLQGNTYDMIHIDGCHSSDIVIKDIENTLPLCRPGTLIVMDDYDFSNIHEIWNHYIQKYNLRGYTSIRSTPTQDIRIY